MSPVEMFNELLRQGYVVPIAIDQNTMTMPSLYRSVPTMTTAGTVAISSSGELAQDAELGRGVKGNCTNP